METIEHLTELLNQKNRRIDELEERVDELGHILDGRTWGWTIHSEMSEDENMNLPVPRLEMRWHELDDWGYNWAACYSLIYRHFLGNLVSIPFGYTKRGGDSPPMTHGKIDLPFREGAHIKHDAALLNLPAFVVYQEQAYAILENVPGETGT